MKRKLLKKPCPVCNGRVFALRITRIYCGETCKGKHHANARNQIADRVEFEKDIRIELFGESEYAQDDLIRSMKLFSRNLYYLDSVMGPEYNSFCGNIKELKVQKFQLDECSFKSVEAGLTVYNLSNYKYWMEGEIFHVERVFAGPKYNDCVVGRWLYSYPDLRGREQYNEKELGILKNFILKNFSIWRE